VSTHPPDAHVEALQTWRRGATTSRRRTPRRTCAPGRMRPVWADGAGCAGARRWRKRLAGGM